MVDVPARLVVVRGKLRVIVEDNGNRRRGKVCFQLVAVLVPYYLVHVDTEACVVEDAAVVLVRGELAPEDGDGLYLRDSCGLWLVKECFGWRKRGQLHWLHLVVQ